MVGEEAGKVKRQNTQSETVALPHLYQAASILVITALQPHHKLLRTTPLTRIGMFSMFLHSHSHFT